MPQEFARNGAPAYYARPNAFRCTIGAAALGPAVPTAAALGGAQATGSIAFSAQPGDGSTITIFGLPIAFSATAGFDLKTQAPGGAVLSVTGVPLPFQAVAPTGLTVKIAANLAATLANLVGLLRSWPDYALAPAHFTLSGNALAIQARDPGTGGNTLTIVAGAGSNGTASGATLSGGTGITPVPDTGSDKYDRRIETLWGEWERRADVAGQMGFYGLQSLSVRSMVESGEGLMRFIDRPLDDARRVPLQLQALERKHS